MKRKMDGSANGMVMPHFAYDRQFNVKCVNSRFCEQHQDFQPCLFKESQVRKQISKFWCSLDLHKHYAYPIVRDFPKQLATINAGFFAKK